jgi:hypothetical protein
LRVGRFPTLMNRGIVEQSPPRSRWLRFSRKRQITPSEERLRIFEARYQMPSETFYRRLRAGELDDTADRVEWGVFYEMWEAVQERLEDVEVESA